MLSRLVHFAKEQSAEEIRRQAVLSNRTETQRRQLALVPFATGAIFVSPALCALLALIHLALEVRGLRLLNSTDPPRQPKCYLMMLGAAMLNAVGQADSDMARRN